MKQTTSHILMIAPTNFGFNEEAFITNKFQQRPDPSEQSHIQDLVLEEFNSFVKLLSEKGVFVHVYSDVQNSTTPDSIFPNNWISTHQTGELITYPMGVSNRRGERRQDIISSLISEYGFKHIDFSDREEMTPPRYLEGTGSLILDHKNKIIYGAISPRTDKKTMEDLAKTIGYESVAFNAYGKTGELIYHTNVMMCIGDRYILIGTDTIDEKDKARVMESIQSSGKEIINLSNDQTHNHFAGNMLQIENEKGQTILVMSKTAYDSLNEDQLARLNALNDHIVSTAIPTIERIGGGSARCMLAELFLMTR
ncbi:MAG: hypothetical protein HRT57_07985 [Crocinitomicaceae bacterium]|nr:hypothetical protein [Crocinitomicaceae bacterium]